MVSNTPLDWVLNRRCDLDTLVHAGRSVERQGALPRDLAGVAVGDEGHPVFQPYPGTPTPSSGPGAAGGLQTAIGAIAAGAGALPEARLLAKASDPAVYNIIELIYARPPTRAIPRTTSSLARRWRTIGAPAIATPRRPSPPRSPDPAPKDPLGGQSLRLLASPEEVRRASGDVGEAN